MASLKKSSNKMNKEDQQPLDHETPDISDVVETCEKPGDSDAPSSNKVVATDLSLSEAANVEASTPTLLDDAAMDDKVKQAPRSSSVTLVKGRDVDKDASLLSDKGASLIDPTINSVQPLPLSRNGPMNVEEQPGAYAVLSIRPETGVPQSRPHREPSPNHPQHLPPAVATTNDGLVEANLVSSSIEVCEIPHANPVEVSNTDTSRRDEAKKLQSILFCIGLALATAGVILGLTFGLSKHAKGNTGPTPQPTQSTAPSLAPTSSFYWDLLPSYSQETIQRHPDSAQAQAYHWLMNDPYLGNYSNSRMMQRYSLATFYFATQGKNWFSNGNTTSSTRDSGPRGRQPPNGVGGGPPTNATAGGPPMYSSDPAPLQFAWLDYQAIHECNWYNMNYLVRKPTCNEQQEYIHLELKDNNLKGSLPPELALLTCMESLALHKNRIRGTIPKEIFTSWTKVYEIILLINELSGSVPSQLGLWHNTLRRLSLQGNDFIGSLPLEIWQLSRLELLHLKFNALTGSISSHIGNLDRLGSIEFQNNGFHSSLPTEIGKVTSLYRLQFASLSPWALPSQLGLLTDLAFLTLDNANLTGTIPTTIGLLSNLQRLSLNGNPFLVGSIPPSLGELAAAPSLRNQTPACPKRKPPMPPPRRPLEELDLELVSLTETGLTGTLPLEWCDSLQTLCFDCSNSSHSLCGCGCPCFT